jgi:NADP-dependent 3-hydroxy acid dehydrogenase YdfG
LASSQVACDASKFGLRGAIQALRLVLKVERIGFTVINPGNVATAEVLRDIQKGRLREQTPIPIADVISSIEWVLSLSLSVEVGDIDLIVQND